MYKQLLSCLLALLFLSVSVFGATTGKIRGVVTDKETKDPLPGANVMIVGTTMGAAANINGEFIILNVPVGTYTVKASFVGYRDVNISNVRVSVALTTETNFELPSEALEGQEVTIVAERPLVDKNATHEIHTVDAKQIEMLPMRGVASTLNVLPGLVNDNGVHVRGGRSAEMAYYVDGINVTMPGSGANGLSIIHNSIEEISYHAGGFGAEFGTRMSGQTFTTLKSGTADYHFGGEVVSDDFWAIKDDEKGYQILGMDKVYSFGYDDYVLHASGPVPFFGNKLKFYVAGQRYWRAASETWFEGFQEDSSTIAWGTWYTAGKDAGKKITDTLSLAMNLPGGRYPGGGTAGWTYNGNFNLDLKPFQIKFGGTFNTQRDQGGTTDPRGFLVTPVRTQLNKRGNYSAYIGITHTVNPTTLYTLNVNYFSNFSEYGDPNLGWDRSDWPSWGDPLINPALVDTSATRSLTGPGAFTITYPGTPSANYGKDKTDMLGAKLDFTKQIGSAHELMIGGELNAYTIRHYFVVAREYLRRQATAAAVAGTPNYMTDWDFYKGLSAEFIGYDIHGETEVNDDEYYPTNVAGTEVKVNARNKPGKPVFAGAYIRDKIEMKDLIINAGLRFDYIDNGVPGLVDLRSIYAGTNQTIADKNYTDNRTFTYVSPRLGFSFPVTDNVIFHAQYGHYVQPARTDGEGIGVSSLGMLRYSQFLYGGGYAVQLANPNLKPERQVAYEFGFKQSFGNLASLDITAFYKDTKDLTSMRVIFPLISDYRAPYMNVNEDFGTIKGLSTTFNLRRTHHIQVMANYTYSIAKGTGSQPDSHFDIAWQESTPTFPVVIGRLDFDQTHKGWIDVDVRSLAGEGPELFGMYPLGNAGLNLAFAFHSGSPYTRTSAEYGAEGVFTYNAPVPLESYNISSVDWFYQIDLKLDKTFKVGPVEFNAYLWIDNVLNSKSILNGWRATGRPDDNGWLQTEAGRKWANQYGEAGVKWYKAILTGTGSATNLDPDGWQAPRVIRGGLKFDL